MVESLNIQAGPNNPRVFFNKSTQKLYFEGKSILINPNPFYSEIHQWITSYIKANKNSEFVVEFFYDYINSASMRSITDLLSDITKNKGYNNSVKILWKFNKDDDIIRERGEELESVLHFSFTYVEVDE